MATITSWLITYWIHSTFIIGVTLLVLAKKRHRFRGQSLGILKGALLAGILTTSLQTTFFLGPFSLKIPAQIQTAIPETPTPQTHSTAINSPGHPSDPGSTLLAQPWQTRFLQPLSWPVVFVFFWLAGVLVLTGIHVMRRRLLFKEIKHRTAVGGPLLSLFEEIKRKAGIETTLTLTASPKIGSPIVIGNREICIPEKLDVNLTKAEQACVLAHEMGHLRHQDSLWLKILNLLKLVLFFQPLNGTASRMLREAMEVRCDHFAIRTTGDPLSMAKSLVKFATGPKAYREAFLPGILFSRQGLKERTAHILEDQQPPAKTIGYHPKMSAFLLGALVLGCYSLPNLEVKEDMKQKKFEFSVEGSVNFETHQTLFVKAKGKRPFPGGGKIEARFVQVLIQKQGDAYLSFATEDGSLYLKDTRAGTKTIFEVGPGNAGGIEGTVTRQNQKQALDANSLVTLEKTLKDLVH